LPVSVEIAACSSSRSVERTGSGAVRVVWRSRSSVGDLGRSERGQARDVELEHDQAALLGEGVGKLDMPAARHRDG
jgi:hypothetical protein